MALDTEIKGQLGQYLELLESDVVFKASLGEDENSGESQRVFAGNRRYVGEDYFRKSNLDPYAQFYDHTSRKRKAASRSPVFRWGMSSLRLSWLCCR